MIASCRSVLPISFHESVQYLYHYCSMILEVNLIHYLEKGCIFVMLYHLPLLSLWLQSSRMLWHSIWSWHMNNGIVDIKQGCSQSWVLGHSTSQQWLNGAPTCKQCVLVESSVHWSMEVNHLWSMPSLHTMGGHLAQPPEGTPPITWDPWSKPWHYGVEGPAIEPVPLQYPSNNIYSLVSDKVSKALQNQLETPSQYLPAALTACCQHKWNPFCASKHWEPYSHEWMHH